MTESKFIYICDFALITKLIYFSLAIDVQSEKAK